MKKAQRMPLCNCAQRGFTLIELMITITLVAIVASIAAPNMRTYILNNRLNSASQELLRTLQTARSEASKRQHNVVVCASANPQDTTPSCTTTSGAAIGWIMFEDFSATVANNNNWERDDSTEALIEAHTFESSKMKLLANGSQRVAYLPTGFASLGTGTAPKIPSTGMVMCDSRGNKDSNGTTTGTYSVARGLSIAPTGRARITRVLTDITTMLGSATC